MHSVSFRLLSAISGLLGFLLFTCASHAQTWTKLTVPATSPTPALYATQFFTRDSGFVCGVAGSTPTGRLYFTSDGGTTWSQISLPGSPAALNDLFFLQGTRVGVIVGDGGYVAVTTDRGQNWTQRSVSITGWSSGIDINGVCFLDTANGFVVGNVSGSGSGPRFARTTDAGRTWSAIAQTDPPSNNLYDILFFDRSHGLVVGTGTPPRKSLSADSGRTWSAYDSLGTRGSSSLSFFGVDAVAGTGTAFAAGGRSFASPLYAEIRRTTDYGATWQQTAMNGSATGYAFPASDAAAVSDSEVYICGWNANIYRTLDGGRTWRAETLPTGVAASVDLRKFSRTSDNWLYAVGTSGTVIRIQLDPNATFSSGTIDFGAICAGNAVGDQTLTIGNDRDGVLTITGVSIAQPSGGITFQVVTPPAPTVAARKSTSMTLRALVPSTMAAGTYTGLLRIRTNDENGSGADTLRTIPISITINSKTLVYDASVNRNVGRVRADGMIQLNLTMTDLIRDTSECPVRIDSARMAIGTDFTLTPITTGLLPARTGKRSLEVSFIPRTICDRYDTVLVFHNGAGSPLRVPVVGTGTQPSFATDPVDTLDFGGIGLGRSIPKTITVKNDRPVGCIDSSEFTSFKITGPNASEFKTTFSLPAPVYLPVNGTLPIPITATPTAGGRRIAYALFKSEALGDLQDTIVLVMNGLEAQFTPIREEIVFDTTDVGGTVDSTVASFLVNYGSLAVNVDSIRFSGAAQANFSYLTPATPFNVTTNQAKSITLRFAPDKPGRFESQMAIYTDLSTKPLIVTVVGFGAYPSIIIQPTQVAFPQTPVNICSDSTIERFIYNAGPVPLRVRRAHIVPAPGADPNDTLAFLYVAPAIPPELVIPPRDSARITLRFCPKRAGVHRADLAFEVNIPGAPPGDVELLGNGQAGTAVSIDTIRFARTRVLSVRDTTVQKLIFNRLAGALNVDSLTITGADALSFNLIAPGSPFLLSPAHDTAAQIRFSPMRRGDHYAFLNIYTSQGPHTVVLAGRAIYPFLRIEPRNLADLRVRVGSTRHVLFDISNDGDDSARIDAAAITGDPAFANPSVGSFPQRLLPTEKLSIGMDFTPTHPCEHPATIRLRGEGVQGIYASADTVVSLNGIGTIVTMSGRRPEILFGTRPIGSQSDSVLNDFLGDVDFADTIVRCLDDGRIDSMTITGPGSGAFSIIAPADPLAPRTVSAGTYLPFILRFQPTTLGLSSADLKIYREGSPDSTLTIRLAGAAANVSVTYGPAPNMIEIDFGKVHRGWVRDSLFTITNNADTPIPLDALAPMPAGEFTLAVAGGVPQVLTPAVPTSVGVHFAPDLPLGARRSAVRLQSGGTVDSIFILRAVVVDDQLRSEPLVDFGPRAIGSVNDSTIPIRNEISATITDPALLDVVAIDRVVIADGAEWFAVVTYPPRVGANSRDSMVLRFNAVGAPGARSGMARIYFNKRTAGAATLFDSLDIPLRGVVGSAAKLQLSLGADQTGVPGDHIHIPIVISGSDPIPDSLALVLSFEKRLLRPLAVLSRSDVAVSFSGPIIGQSDRGTTQILLGGSGLAAGGTIAELECEVLLGDTLMSDLLYESADVPSRPEISFDLVGMRFVVNGFCDASGRRISFDLGPALKSSRNPIGGSTTIEYAVPAVTNVRLAIYDALGHEVARLADGEMNPGLYTAPFDASRLASGPYYCVLIAGRFSATLTIQVIE